MKPTINQSRAKVYNSFDNEIHNNSLEERTLITEEQKGQIRDHYNK